MQDASATSVRPTGLSLDRAAGLRVAIIGAGFSGIAAAYYLKRANLTNFLILERSSAAGGTWHDNSYPGAEVDVPCHLYSFTFNQNDWTQRYSSQADVKRYLDKTIDEFDLRAHLRCDATVVSAEWSDETKLYKVAFADGRIAEFEAVICCVGIFSVPLIPREIDVASYPGVVCHTSPWNKDVRFEGMRVGVVGTGSSAVQIVAEAAKVARSVTVFQRSANWVVPKRNRTFTAAQQARYRKAWQYRFKWLKEYLRYERIKFMNPDRLGSRTNVRMQAIAENYLKRSLAGRGDLLVKLTPDHPIGAKRAVASDDYYAALQKPNVVVAPAVKRVDADGVCDAEGRRHHLDVLVLATGFRTADYLSKLRISGRDGVDLHETWHGEPAAFLGTCVPGFPNFFMLYGPNSNSGTLVLMLEAQARFAVDSLAEMARSNASTVEVKASVFEKFNRWVQKKLEGSVYATTRNYYQASSGRVVTQWPFTATRFWWMCRTQRRSAMKIS
ncbi:MAG: NAD(P)/FAD-dependent oxidoreductase [Hyphomicrobiales bacterium]|nr:NAD(P)/FAD-dependent oxidoreductase [Hyphomicrobiales bacterium]